MPQENRPRGREKNVTGQGKGVYRRGSGNGGGPVGGGMSGRPTGGRPSSGGSGSGAPMTRAGGKGGLLGIILAIVVALGGGGGILGSLLGGGGSSGGVDIGQAVSGLGGLSSILGGASEFAGNTVSSGWTGKANTGKLDTSVASGSRAKYTTINGDGTDKVTIMVYMCGTDLESKGGMATADLNEMASAALNDKINLIVYTGGCKKWQTQGISSSTNQIYKVEKGKLTCLNDNVGNKAMTRPETLVEFINYCESKFPANRNMLIFWDHGGGSVSGYGYDEKNSSSGSMTLSGINTALKTAGKKFDIIGFDACLMATAENALMLTPYADYLIASEETEPGIGWYYTNWLNALAKDPAMASVKIGQNIVDDFVDTCAQKCRGQKATLSVVDLAELEKTVPEELSSFASSTLDLLKNDSYKTVSDARSGSREFAASSKIDQVDLVNLAQNMGTKDGTELANAILGAVKYNRTSSDMTNAYGLSIFFPYQKSSTVDTAVKTYEAIGMDGEYADCIKQFASLEVSGQAVSGGSASQLSSLLGSLTGSSSGSSSGVSGTSAISGLLNNLIGGGASSLISGLDSSNTGFLSSLLNIGSDRASAYLNANSFDASKLEWKKSGSQYYLGLDEDQWKLVHDLELSVFYDDGEGFLDLGLDNVFTFTTKGYLLGEYDGTWLAINDQPIAYYHESTVDDGTHYTITGRVPVKLNGDRADLILVFDDANPHGYVAGVRYDYRAGETDTVAKALDGLKDGDVIDFLCDYYDYNGNYLDNYCIGEQLTVSGGLTISDVYIDAANANACYRFTDIYNQQYWTPLIP